jgi:hypothetical protein
MSNKNEQIPEYFKRTQTIKINNIEADKVNDINAKIIKRMSKNR